MPKFIGLCIMLLASFACQQTNAETCHDFAEQRIDRYLATKTPYRLIANHNTEPYAYPGCRPTAIWSLIRHGTRQPNNRVLHAIRNDLRTISGQIAQAGLLCDRDRQMFADWMRTRQESDDKLPNEMDLMQEGFDELLGLAERMQARFPDLMPVIYRNESYRFKFTDTQRTRKSFEAFVTGLFKADNIDGIWYPQPEARDPILRFYKLCERWKKDVKDNTHAMLEVDNFRVSKHMTDAVDRVARRAGVPLTSSQVHLIYTVCAFETAWHRNESSPWCTLFNTEDIQTFEYLEDLKHFYIDGYGTDLTHQQACPALNDMIDRLTSGDSPKATFYFTHSGTVLKVLSALDLYQDHSPLRSAHYDNSAGDHRKWRVGKMDAFASNLVFVLYTCTGEDEQNNDRILVLHQERPVRLNGCPNDSDLCPLWMFRAKFQNTLGDNCHFDEMCSMKAIPKPHTAEL